MTIPVDTTVEWVPTDDTFGARLALVRQRFGWNMKEAAAACGLPQNSWIEWESKGRTPRNLPAIAQQIHAATGVNDYWLMTGKRTGILPSAPVLVHPLGLEPRTH